MGAGGLGHGVLKRVDIGNVAGQEYWCLTMLVHHGLDEFASIRALDEGDLGALLQETFSQRGADA